MSALHLRLTQLLLVFLATCCAFGTASAQPGDWPARPIRLVVPYPPGTGPDIMARLVTEKLAKELPGQLRGGEQARRERQHRQRNGRARAGRRLHLPAGGPADGVGEPAALQAELRPAQGPHAGQQHRRREPVPGGLVSAAGQRLPIVRGSPEGPSRQGGVRQRRRGQHHASEHGAAAGRHRHVHAARSVQGVRRSHPGHAGGRCRGVLRRCRSAPATRGRGQVQAPGGGRPGAHRVRAQRADHQGGRRRRPADLDVLRHAGPHRHAARHRRQDERSAQARAGGSGSPCGDDAAAASRPTPPAPRNSNA